MWFGRVVPVVLVGLLLPFSADAQPVQDVIQGPDLGVVELEWSSHRPDGHAPIGVMGDHVHEKGEWMLSYRYMRMNMQGNRDGTDSLSTREVLRDFMVAPTHMEMDMHMVGAMVAPVDWLTLTMMVPYTQLSMTHENRMGVNFTTESQGFGDIRLGSVLPVLKKDRHALLLNMGASFPTGSINQRDTTPAGRNQKLPYPMQLGSGTYDLLPGLTYVGQTDHWSWGAQAGSTIRLGKNTNDYRLGNRIFISPWLSRKWTNWLSTSVRVNGQAWGDISGTDPDLTPAMVQTANSHLQGGKRLDLLFGLNLFVPKGFLRNHRLAVEMGFPVYQNLGGPQLETDFILTAGWQWAVN